MIECLGELARVGGDELAPHVDELVSLAVDQLSGGPVHAALAKRDAALKTLGRVASNTGHVVSPYIAYPSLLGALVKILRTEQAPPVRRETIRVLGVLGALDPYRHKLLESSLDPGGNGSSTQTDLFELATVLGTSTDESLPME